STATLAPRFTPRFGPVSSAVSVGWDNFSRGLPSRTARFTRGRTDALTVLDAHYWHDLFLSPRRSTDFYYLSTAVWPWKTSLLQAFLRSLPDHAREFLPHVPSTYSALPPSQPITMASPRDDPDDSDLMDFEPPDDTDS
ncbi:unnamed protein product, partial [Pylaiella littoralis]